MNDIPSKNLKDSYYLPVIFFVFFAVIVIINVCVRMADVSLTELYSLLLNDLYHPERNVIYPIISLINYAYFSIFAFTSIVGYLILKGKVAFLPIVYSSCFLTFMLSISFQTSTHLHHFKKDINKYHGKTLSEKMAQSPMFVYPFAQYCQHYLPGKHSCQFLSDKDFSEEAYMLQFIKLRYHLYPIDIYFNRSSESDCAVLFLKETAANHVPDHFRAMQPFSLDSLIAIRDK